MCFLCANRCSPARGELGYCGVRRAGEAGVEPVAGRMSAIVQWYLDPLPTNCVAAWACGEAAVVRTGRAYNLAVFYNGCNFDCLFCQNWHHRRRDAPVRRADELARAAEDNRVKCVCYFGGDPTPHSEHALTAARLVMERREGEVRICWETNGAMSVGVLARMIEVSMETGGTIKFDLKAWSRGLHEALCGVSNEQTLSNFRILAERAGERPEPPLAAASTLLVPGYVDASEVGAIARYIAKINPDVPYSLLAFHPDYAMSDLPTTSRRQAEECLEAALDAGLTRVRIGNAHLLS